MERGQDLNKSKHVCFGCTICFGYLHEVYNCQGQSDETCHEFDDRYATKKKN